MSAPRPRNWLRSLLGERPAPPAPPLPEPRPRVAFDFADERIPDTSSGRLATIRTMLDEFTKDPPQTAAATAALVEVERIRDVYLPELMHSYFAIPAQHRAEIFRETGRSASFLLDERLDKLIGRLREMSRRIAQSPLDLFNQNLGFVDSRFGDPDEPFEWQRD